VTVVIALMCADGVVMASDSQVTDSARGMSYPAQKLHDLGSDGAWGGSGARSVLLEVEEEFDRSAAAILESESVSREIQERVLPILKHHYDNFIVNVPGEESGGTPSAYVLASGYSHGEPFIVEVNPNGMVSHYEDVGFHAVGGGAAMAQQAGALLAHFRMTERSIDHGVVAVVRVIDALRVTLPSVGGEVDVCRISPEGARHLTDDEVNEARAMVGRWEDLEQQAMDDLFA
jgi:20S proteasome alpha/beta subunit